VPTVADKARTATRFATPGDNALHGRMLRPNLRVAVRLKKPAAGFPARALEISAMMKICR